MKKRDLKKLAFLGLTIGLMANQLSGEENKDKASQKQEIDPAKGNLGYHLMSEDELLIELNAEGTALYNSLTPQGKALARYVASTRCQGSNKCQGLNACATDKNDCAGKGSCEGQGKCAFSDKNLAVRVVAKKMAQQRAKMNGQSSTTPTMNRSQNSNEQKPE